MLLRLFTKEFYKSYFSYFTHQKVKSQQSCVFLSMIYEKAGMLLSHLMIDSGGWLRYDM